MAMVNRRNAVLGWAVWKIASNVAKKKAKRAVPARGDHKSGWRKRGAVGGLGVAAATGGPGVFWRKKNDDTPPVV